MTDSFPIVPVQAEWALDPEDMGSKRKFWYHDPGARHRWLFKHPRPGTGEHWAEKIAAEVGRVLAVSCAVVELAEFRGDRGSAACDFLLAQDMDFPLGRSLIAPREREELFHGNQVLGQTVPDYDSEQVRSQPEHSLDNIWRAFERVFIEPEAAERKRREFAGYLVLDAVIGNTDRHHENWGLGRIRQGDGWIARLAPSFDHASSLGRELRDRKRGILLDERRIGSYAEKARGEIFLTPERTRPPSPLDLVRSAVEEQRQDFDPVLARLHGLRDSVIGDIVDRVPADWMNSVARDFATTLIRYNRDQLLELAR